MAISSNIIVTTITDGKIVSHDIIHFVVAIDNITKAKASLGHIPNQTSIESRRSSPAVYLAAKEADTN